MNYGNLNNIIGEKLTVMAIDTHKYLYKIEETYKQHIEDNKLMYKEPEKHLSKIMVMSYNQTVNDYNYKGCSQ